MTTGLMLDFRQAMRTYALANAPTYLIRNLRLDPATYGAQIGMNSAQVIDALRQILATPPKDLEDYVAPYVLLCALAQKQDKLTLQAASMMPAPYHHWYRFVADMLWLETPNSHSRTFFAPPPAPFIGGRASSVSSSSSSSTFKLPERK